jgi:hypothetical protein
MKFFLKEAVRSETGCQYWIKKGSETIEVHTVQSQEAQMPTNQIEVQKQLEVLAKPSQDTVPPDQAEVRKQLEALSQTKK